MKSVCHKIIPNVKCEISGMSGRAGLVYNARMRIRFVAACLAPLALGAADPVVFKAGPAEAPDRTRADADFNILRRRNGCGGASGGRAAAGR